MSDLTTQTALTLLKCARQFTLTVIPDELVEHDPDVADMLSLKIVYRGLRRGQVTWAVQAQGRYVISADMEPEYEPLPSNRTDMFLDRYRFTSLTDAYNVAVGYLPLNKLRLWREGKLFNAYEYCEHEGYTPLKLAPLHEA